LLLECKLENSPFRPIMYLYIKLYVDPKMVSTYWQNYSQIDIKIEKFEILKHKPLFPSLRLA